jgi:probable addiction module antidote protein
VVSLSKHERIRIPCDSICARHLGAHHGKQTKNQGLGPADHLETEEDIAAYLDAAFEEHDTSLIAAALGDVAGAKGMAQIARDAGLGRESLYKALSPDGNLEFATIMKVVDVLGIKLRAPPLVEYREYPKGSAEWRVR